MQQRKPDVVDRAGGGREEFYSLSTDEAYLRELIEYIFHEYWQGLVFGPIIEGAAFEITCAHTPVSITLLDGYLTVHFGRTHFHLCIGENRGSPDSPTLPELRARRRTARAEPVRGLDSDGAPQTWSLRLFNGAGEQQLTVFFPNPFLTSDDRIAKAPDRSQLAAWEDVAARYLGLEPDPRDRTAAVSAGGVV
ncbi:MAG: hypothetical protein OET44_16785, partial [Gammaproteobacteria bacterium]|nr:hypothetical protein [Gammaproteobacteria bacterium]